MDAFLDKIFSEYGLLVLGLVIICGVLWRKSESQSDQIMKYLTADIERSAQEKIQNENIHTLLVAVKGTTDAIFKSIDSIPKKVSKALRKAR